MNLLRSANASSQNIASLFEIRIDSTDRDVIVLRGASSESPGVLLKGVVVLSLHEAIQARNITLRLRGKASAAWTETYTTPARSQGARAHKEESIIYEHSWSFLSFSTHNKTIGVGNYEYPFDVMLPGDLPESVEGLEHGSIRYTMVATIDRPAFTQNLVARKHLRVVRTLSVDSLEMAQTLSVDNTWPNKIEYAISIPTKSYPIGSSIPINFKLVPLLKGLCVTKIICTLKEYQSLSIAHGYYGTPVKKEVDRVVSTCTIDGLEPNVSNWELDEVLNIPSSLNECVQDCEVKHITVRHKLKFTVSLQNPDGHISELRAALAVGLLIPPNIFSAGPNFTSLNPTDPANQLPSYDSHIYDRLYDGIETPLPSGMNTPAQSRSRRGSIEAGPILDGEQQRRALIAGLNRLTMSSAPLSAPVPVNGGRNHDSGRNSGHTSGTSTPYSRSHPNSFTPGSFTPAFSENELAQSLQTSTVNSGVASPRLHAEDTAIPAPFTQEELDGLNRIPSYETATTRAAAAPLSGSLPNYEAPMRTESNSNSGSGSSTPATGTTAAPPLTRPAAARMASHRTGILRSAHERFARARDT